MESGPSSEKYPESSLCADRSTLLIVSVDLRASNGLMTLINNLANEWTRYPVSRHKQRRKAERQCAKQADRDIPISYMRAPR